MRRTTQALALLALMMEAVRTLDNNTPNLNIPNSTGNSTAAPQVGNSLWGCKKGSTMSYQTCVALQIAGLAVIALVFICGTAFVFLPCRRRSDAGDTQVHYQAEFRS